jgi:hypothetical protein
MRMEDLPAVIELLSWVVLPLCIILSITKKDKMIAILGVPLALFGLFLGYMG